MAQSFFSDEFHRHRYFRYQIKCTNAKRHTYVIDREIDIYHKRCEEIISWGCLFVLLQSCLAVYVCQNKINIFDIFLLGSMWISEGETFGIKYISVRSSSVFNIPHISSLVRILHSNKLIQNFQILPNAPSYFFSIRQPDS